VLEFLSKNFQCENSPRVELCFKDELVHLCVCVCVCVCWCCSVLLSHLAADVDGVTRQVDRQLLRETVRAFMLTNDDLAGGTVVSETNTDTAADIQLACSSCQVGYSLTHQLTYLIYP